VAGHQQDLADLLEYLPLHDATLSSAVRDDYLQIVNNLIICGVPGGGSSTAPAFTCAANGGGNAAGGAAGSGTAGSGTAGSGNAENGGTPGGGSGG
jgi:hypothetical protein